MGHLHSIFNDLLFQMTGFTVKFALHESRGSLSGRSSEGKSQSTHGARRRSASSTLTIENQMRFPTDLLYVGTSGLTESRDGIDGGNPLCQKCVGSQLGQLCTPQVGGKDAF